MRIKNLIIIVLGLISVLSSELFSQTLSNLERINRWQSAFRLFKERPILGWGPGAYQFVYAPYQKAKEKTQY